MPPGGSPKPPECPADEAEPAGAAPLSVHRRHRLTPLGEGGDKTVVLKFVRIMILM